MDTITATIPTPNHLVLVVLLFITISRSFAHHRRLLKNHTVSSSSPQPSQQPKHPTSTGAGSGGSRAPQFFPSDPSVPPSPSPYDSIPTTIPANISSLALPQSQSSPKPHSTSLVTAAAWVSPIVIIFFLLALFFYCRRRRRPTADAAQKPLRCDSLQLLSTDRGKPPRGGSSEFLYLGTLVNSRIEHDTDSETVSPGQKLGSPELCPLPPLPRLNFQQDVPSNKEGSSSRKVEKEEDDDEEEFYSPRGSAERAFLNPPQDFSNSSSPTHSSCNHTASASPALNSSPSSSISNSTPRCSDLKQHPERIPPPPPPPPGYWKAPVLTPEPPIPIKHHAPNYLCQSSTLQDSSAEQPQNSASMEMKNDVIPKPKLKPLHWDKVKASSGRAMVWDRLKSSSFKLNEDMIETLFMVSGSNLSQTKNLVTRMHNQENHVLDPKKSQNIAILLRALNVTIDEVCEALLEGNADALGSELLESLLKMGPTKEEERELRAFRDDSPVRLGPAERFLKAVIDIPFAFKRVNAMLYVANFDSEAEYLKKCFETLQAACGELRNSRMFLKLLEAVLKTGNRMNVGTNRGDAHAFQLGTLLKLVDVKGADGKTTLLHFVVQEIMRAEASRGDSRVGLRGVCGLSNELTNVKKAAAMDSDMLCNDAKKLAQGIIQARNTVKLVEETETKDGRHKFCGSMNGFLQRAEEEMGRIETQKGVALSQIKELVVYFHGDSVREEAHPSRIFMVVRDFLCSLDHVCKEVGKLSDRQFPLPKHGTAPPFHDFELNTTHEFTSSNDETH